MESGSRAPIELRDGMLVMGGGIARADLPGLCDGADAMVRDLADDPVVCNVGALTAPDLVAVETLARIALTARRMGVGLELEGADPELRSLLALAGLAEVLPCRARTDDPRAATDSENAD